MTFSFGITILFIIYILFWIQVPGMLFQELLLPHRLKLSTRLLAAFFIGFIYMAALYLIESLTGLTGIIAIAGPVTSIFTFYLYFKGDHRRLYNATETFKWSGIIIFVFIYVASVLNLQLKYNGALSGITTQVYHDYLFHTGNIASLSVSFPNADYRVSGLTFYYHYFYELIFAMCKHIFHMDAFRVYMNGNALLCAGIDSLALVIVGERIRGGKVTHRFNYFLYCVGTLVSCIALLPLNVAGAHLPLSWMDNHLFTNANSLGMAMALSMVVVDILADLWYDNLDGKVVLVLFMLAVAATGFKGTTGVLLVGITWAVFIVEMLITKKFHSNRLIYAITLTAGFIITYLFVTVGLHSSGANNRATKLTVEGTLDAGRVGQIIEKLGFDYMAFPWVIIGVILACICIIGPCIFAFSAFAIEKFKTLIKENVIGDIFDWFAIGSVLMGLIGYLSFDVPGNSQVYFVITNVGFIFYGTATYIINHKRNWIAYVTYLFMGVGAAFLAIDMAYYCYSDMQQNKVYSAEAGDAPELVSADTMEAYLWLRDHTPKDSIVAVDRLSEELDYRSIYFYCSAFAERQCYLEGYDYSDVDTVTVEQMLETNESFYGDDIAAAKQAMSENGVDYLVVTRLMHPDFHHDGSAFTEVFSNDEVTIYSYD